MLAVAFLGLVLAKPCPDGEVDVDGTCYPKTCVFDGTVCNGHGSCFDGECFCEMDYLLTELGCYPSGCSDTHTGYVCGRHGTCIKKNNMYTCDCMDDYMWVGNDCVSPSCMYNSGVCNFSGRCLYDEDDNPYCSCDYIAKGDHCEECSDVAVMLDGRCIDKKCVTERSDGTLVECGGFGTCLGIPPEGKEPFCLCDLGTVQNDLTCIPNSCRNGPKDFDFCSKHGYCNEARTCVCDDGYTGEFCQYEKLDCDEGYVYVEGQCVKQSCISEDGHVCHGLGVCKGEVCVCDDNCVLIGTAECTPAVCMVDGAVCPHGKCVTAFGQAHCKCNAEYTAYNNRCIPNSCISGTNAHEIPEICSDRGTCDLEKRKCICDAVYTGTHCQKCSEDAITMEDGTCASLNCVSKDSHGDLVVCSGKGKCKSVGFGTDAIYVCVCNFGYQVLDTSTCVSQSCMSDDVIFKPCSGHGICEDKKCICDKGFKGDLCEDYDCPKGETYVLSWGCTPSECVTEYTDGRRRICSGYGHCVKKGHGHTCECRPQGKLIDGMCVSPECLTENNTVCHGTSACRDGRCI